MSAQDRSAATRSRRLLDLVRKGSRYWDIIAEGYTPAQIVTARKLIGAIRRG